MPVDAVFRSRNRNTQIKLALDAREFFDGLTQRSSAEKIGRIIQSPVDLLFRWNRRGQFRTAIDALAADDIQTPCFLVRNPLKRRRQMKHMKPTILETVIKAFL